MTETAERLYREARARIALEQSGSGVNSAGPSVAETSLPLSPRSPTSDHNDTVIEEIEVQNSP